MNYFILFQLMMLEDFTQILVILISWWWFFLQQQVQNFGEPFFLVIHEGETLAEVKVRVQKKLQVPDDEFSKVLETHLVSIWRSLEGKSVLWL